MGRSKTRASRATHDLRPNRAPLPKRIARISWSASRCGAWTKTRTTLGAMLPVTAVMIDWSSAVVKPRGRYPELAVRLSTAPDSVWKNEFARAAT